MGDLSSEPSMEEILSSIKRIIAEEGDAPPGRPRRPMRAPPAPPPAPAIRDDREPEHEPDEVLELRHPIPVMEPVTEAPVAGPVPDPVASGPIVSSETAEATRDALSNLSRLLIKPEPDTDGTLEGLVREMLRPVLREWLDARLPGIVEQMVAREIAKITGGVR